LVSIEGPVKRGVGKEEKTIETLELPGVTAIPKKSRLRSTFTCWETSKSPRVCFAEYFSQVSRIFGVHRERFRWVATISFARQRAGLALLASQTIVMDRDKNRRFRTREHLDGISPLDVEMQRGLNEISYLSYVSIPVVSELGITARRHLNHLCKHQTLAVPSKHKLPDPDDDGNCRVNVHLSALTDMAKVIYDQRDECVAYLEENENSHSPSLGALPEVADKARLKRQVNEVELDRKCVASLGKADPRARMITGVLVETPKPCFAASP